MSTNDDADAGLKVYDDSDDDDDDVLVVVVW